VARSAPFLLVAAIWIVAHSAAALESCDATSGDGLQSCSISCGSGGKAICTSGPGSADCTCGSKGGVVSELEISGNANAVSSVQIESWDEACAVLPCTPLLVHSIQVATSVGMSAVDFAVAAETAFLASYGPDCGFSRTGAVLSLNCPDFHAKYRVCDAVPGACADDFVAGTGTSGDLGVDRAGLHFQSLVPFVIPSLGPPGLAFLAGSLALLGARAVGRRDRPHSTRRSPRPRPSE